jgi:hypothetical protein
MRLAIAFVTGCFLGVIAGAGGMLIAFPFLFPPPVVAEAAPDSQSAAQLGMFKFDETAPGRDAVHWANGTGVLYRIKGAVLLRFDETFEAGPGPNYWIYLNTVPVGDEATFNADSGRVKIAPLKSFKGGQNFMLPSDIDIARFHTVTIWCESFSVYIGSAVLPKA